MDENLLLSLIENNAKMEVVDLAAALNETEENVENKIKDLFLFHNEIKNITHHNKKTQIQPKNPKKVKSGTRSNHDRKRQTAGSTRGLHPFQ